jgi:DNA helicase-2/ATP-dependent DNA helicase PcrA
MTEFDRQIASLNPPQREAVLTESGPLLVLAGAGSGKTRVVTFRIARLVRRGIKPDRILAVTFTNKAAAEMLERVSVLLPKRKPGRTPDGKRIPPPRPVVSTFHSYCVKILRRRIERLGYPPRFTIYDRGDQESLARKTLRDIKAPEALLKPSDLLAIIGGWKTKAVRPEQAAGIAETDKEHLAAVAYRRYQRSLKNAGAVDFDDLLLLTEQLLREFPDVRREEASRFDHLLIDEYQDTNAGQYGIVRALAGGHRNLCVVGDDDQSIYAWRGAVVEHILRFKRDWPDAKVVRLVDNYRSTAAILKTANDLIRHNSKRHDKTLKAARPGGEKPRIIQYKSEEIEAEQTIIDIARQLSGPGVEPRDVAILFRTKEQPRLFEAELRRQGIPYVLMGGQSFYDRKEVRDLLAYLRVIDRPRDDSALLRIINTPARGIGDRTVEQLMATAVQQKVPVWQAAGEADALGLAPAAAAALHKFKKTIDALRGSSRRLSLPDLGTRLIETIDYRQEIDRVYPKPEDREARWTSVEQVVTALAQYAARADDPHDLKGFLDETMLEGREPEDDKDKQLAGNAVALLTMHAAKGLEYPHVYMVGLEEGILPHHKSVAADGEAIEEERRLAYVGVTRAQDRLQAAAGRTAKSLPNAFTLPPGGSEGRGSDTPGRVEAANDVQSAVPLPGRSGGRPSRREGEERTCFGR